MKSDSRGQRVPIAEIPEVQAAEDLRAEIEALKAENPQIFMRLNDLIDRYNAAIEVAEKVVRERGVSCGPFENYSTTVKFDPAKMYDEVGEELFLKSGGAIATVSEYSIDKKRVEAAIASGTIPAACVDEFRTVQRNFHKPGKLNI